MRTNEPRKLLLKGFGIIILLGIAIFGYLKYRPILEGPVLQKISIEDWNITNESSITIEGITKNTHIMHMNGQNISIYEDNSFGIVVPLMQGQNNISIYIEDIFGKNKSYEYKIYSTYIDEEYSPTLQEARQEIDADTEIEGAEQETTSEIISMVIETH